MLRGRTAALALALLAAAPAAAEVRVPPLTGPVVDTAGVLDARAVRRLEELSRAARARDGGRGPQLQFLLVPTLEGEAIEAFSMRAAEAWKLGTKGKDDGVLLVVAVKDRRVRIEVGGGIEGGLTDAQAGRIIRNTIVPAFREGRYGEGLHAAGREILAALGALPAGMDRPARPASRTVNIPVVGGILGFLLGSGVPVLILLIIAIVVLRAIFGAGRGGPRGPWGGPPWGGGFGGGGGWGGGGGGGGGGWSGGGGGFSGGGASGSW